MMLPFRKDHYFSRDLQSTIPGDYYFNGLRLTGYIYDNIPGTFYPLFLGFNPPNEGPFQSKQGSFGLQVRLNMGQ